MGWKTVKGRKYFYESVEGDDERVWKCWGSGLEAQQAAARVAEEREATARDLAIVRAWEAHDWEIDRMAAQLDGLVRRETVTHLETRGYRRQNYRWNKARKMVMNSKELKELKDECAVGRHEEKVGLADGLNLEDEVRRLSLESLRGLGTKDPANVTLACQVDQTIEEVKAKVREMQAEFGYETAIPFEKLLIEQIITAWVQWYVASWLLESEHCGARSWRQNQYLERRYLRCQVRLTRVIDQLARMRCVPRAYLTRGRM